MSKPLVSVFERFWKMVDKRDPNECWPWKGYTDTRGYAGFAVRSERKNLTSGKPHRFSWELANAKEIPDDMEIDHTCKNPSCVNPKHLEVVTHAEHMKREQARRTHCQKGHLYEKVGFKMFRERRYCLLCLKRKQRRQIPYKKRWVEENRERVRKLSHDWYMAHKPQISERRARRRIKQQAT